MKKIAAVFTGFDASLYTIVETALKTAMAGTEYTLMCLADPNLIRQTLEAGAVTPKVAREYAQLCLSAAQSGADVILSVCSTMGDAAEAAQPLLEKLAAPLVRIDEAMMRHAVCTYQRIAFVATCDAIMLPNRNLMEKCLRETGSPAQVTYFVLNDMQGKPGAAAADIAADELEKHKGMFDAVVMTQASMAPLTAHMEDKLGIPVLSSSLFGAAAVAAVLQEK